MDTSAQGKENGKRKRKFKFSEQELEVLTKEVVRSHDRLFGKSSLQVPEIEKRRLGADIQSKICAIGVAQRSVDEIKKRWCDLRSCAKERVARRLQEARGTGGGPPTETPSTPLEDLVESTLLPEAVTGVTEIDTSGTPSTSQGGSGPAATASASVGKTDTHPASDSNTSGSLTIAPVRRRPRALPLPELSQDSDEQQEGPISPSPTGRRSQMQETSCQQTSAPHRMATNSGAQQHEAGEGPSFFGGLEAAMLQQQHLQNKRILGLQKNLQQHNTNMGGLHRQLESLNSNIKLLHEGQVQASQDTTELTCAVSELCQELHHERVRYRRQERRFMNMFGGFCRSVNRVANATSLIARRAVAAQVEAAHNSRDVANGLVQITNVIDNILGQRSATPSELALGDTEDSSSLSSVAVPALDTRRRSARHSTATEADNRGASEVTGHLRGVPGRKK
ncbi:nuclear apoptosis-inducing factor 1-like [Pleurodeles waltl]|uniref:nuclear apoptosis-inducing factor 1-like n=1 Tax=Pleurodeles waltl TaxID=8319 RepID=UPI0037096155